MPECIAGPKIFALADYLRIYSFSALRNLYVLHPFEIWRRLAFAPQSRDAFGLSAVQIMTCLAIHPCPHRDLAMREVIYTCMVAS